LDRPLQPPPSSTFTGAETPDEDGVPVTNVEASAKGRFF